MEYKWSVPLTILLPFTLVLLVNCDYKYPSLNKGLPLKRCYQCNTLKPPPGAPGASLACNCNNGNPYNRGRPCCKGAVRYYFKTDQFENIFSNRSSLEVETDANKGFLDYQSFITASALYQPYGFGTTYMNWTFFGTKEVAAFLAHVATKISCEYFRLFCFVNFKLGFYLIGMVLKIEIVKKKKMVWLFFFLRTKLESDF